MRESRTYGSVRGACDETHVPTATDGASSSRCSAARRRRGRLRRARSRASGCGASACSCTWPRTIRKRRPASRRSCRACRNWAGPTAATCGSTSAGPQAMPTAFAETRRNWSRSRRTSSWPMAARPSGRCNRRPAPCRSCSQVVADPVGAGFVDSLARPGGNTTGFMAFEYGLSGKWLELLKADRAGRDASGGPSGFRHIRRHRPVRRHPGRGAVAQGGGKPDQCARRGEIERAITAFAHAPNGGLIVTASGLAIIHRELIVTLAARHKLPAVYYYRFFVTDGGLVSYGPDPHDQYRRAAGYVDRMWRKALGERTDHAARRGGGSGSVAACSSHARGPLDTKHGRADHS